ncbi:peroxisome membrane protein [Coniella lustricola]|uniref:Peroxisomal membrane protein PEX16 n=1 Tax=Coniella lustricola TaxID=2025994 RepID=A0A2T3AEC2_9PEZI|nr:peroxisome membrane protein [Coniella lustricola]
MASPSNTPSKAKRSGLLPSRLHSALALPPKWRAKYDDLVTKNAGQVSQLESALRSLTYIVPGRFRDAELATEGIHSGVQLLSLYHDLVLFRSSLSPPPSPSSSSSSSRATTTTSATATVAKSLHARYTRFWTAKSAFYRRVSIVLQVVQYTELLLEMWAKRRGEALRWRVVVLIEAVKAFCRLLLLRITQARPLVTPPLPEREKVADGDGEQEKDDGTALAELMGELDENGDPVGAENGSTVNGNGDEMALKKHNGTNGYANGHGNCSLHHASGHALQPFQQQQDSLYSKKEWSMPRTGLSLPSLPAPGDISSYLLTRVLSADDIKPATKLLHSLQGPASTAEILHILAPLIYAIALARAAASSSTPSSKRASWIPWLVGLSVQLAARQLAIIARDGNNRNMPALEKEEWSRRGKAMWWWLMRGASYEHVVKGVVVGVRRRMPGFVGTILEDYEYLWENYYFSTSDL